MDERDLDACCNWDGRSSGGKTKVNEMEPYTSLSAYYDQGWGGFAISYLPFLLLQCEQRHLPEPRALDVCCGTGLLAKALAGHGVRVVGVDRSEAMLTQARKNCDGLTNVSFLRGDMTEIAFESEFDIITCTFDSINYLLTESDLLVFFNKIARALKQNGLFIFDSNTSNAYAEWPQKEYAVLEREIDSVAFRQLLRYEPSKPQAEIRFEFPDGSSEMHFQRPWNEADLRQVIETSKLREEWIKSNFDSRPVTEETKRILVLAGKS